MTKEPFKPSMKKLLGSASASELRDLSAARFEHGVTEYILRHYSLGHAKQQLIQEQRAEFGEGWLKLSRFHDHFPAFPLFLFALQIPKVAEDMKLSKLLRYPQFRKCYKSYQSFRDEVPSHLKGTAVGLAFHYPFLQAKGSKGDALVLHDLAVESEHPRLTFTLEGQGLYLERLSTLLKSIDDSRGVDWITDE